MNSRVIFVLVVNFFCINSFSQHKDTAISLQTSYLAKDSLIVFSVSVLNNGCDSIGLYSHDPFNFCDQQSWPNCFFIQRSINRMYYNLYPNGTSQHAYSFDLIYLKKHQSHKFSIAFPIRKFHSPFEPGLYSIAFKIGYIKKKEENTIESETIYFTIY